MNKVGIESINAYGGIAYVDVKELAAHRGLDTARFDNLLMKEKSVALPFEDPVSLGINAAKPIISALSQEDKSKIELVITCTESSFDFGKSMSTYVHDVLGLSRNCRFMEIKNACYSGTAGLQMAVNFILAGTSPGAKALVVATDISRFLIAEGGEALSEDWSFAEPSSGAGAVAMLVSDKPDIFQIDVGANGYYGFEVMDTCRPIPDSEAGNNDLSLMSYLDCCDNTFAEYKKRVPQADYKTSFSYLTYHTPFGGMVKGAHRNMMRKHVRSKLNEIAEDFDLRVVPGLDYCQRVGNIMGATSALSLVSTIENGVFDSPKRIGCFSYGSGCCSEFYSGVVFPHSQEKLAQLNIKSQLDNRYKLTMPEYDTLVAASHDMKFGTRNYLPKENLFSALRRDYQDTHVFLDKIEEFHRVYV